MQSRHFSSRFLRVAIVVTIVGAAGLDGIRHERPASAEPAPSSSGKKKLRIPGLAKAKKSLPTPYASTTPPPMAACLAKQYEALEDRMKPFRKTLSEEEFRDKWAEEKRALLAPAALEALGCKP